MAISRQSAMKAINENNFQSVVLPSVELNVYFHSVIRQSVYTSVRMEMSECPKMHTIEFQKPKEIVELISHCYISILLTTSKAFDRCI